MKEARNRFLTRSLLAFLLPLASLLILSVPASALKIASGGFHACAILADGTVKCWGRNAEGELGLGNIFTRGDASGEMGDNLPVVSLGTGRTATALTATAYTSCALLDDATVKCWGRNAGGELGLGDTGDRGDGPGEMGDALPAVSLGTGRTAAAIDGGADHTCALLDDATVKCWGRNDFGQLGLGDVAWRGDWPGEMGDALPAVSLGAGRTATAIASGGYHTCALLDDATVKCWGYNNEGELGLGDTVWRGDGPGEMGDSLPAVDLGAGRTAVAVAAGLYHSCALLDDATVKCWGHNGKGQLGLGDTSHRGDGPGEMGNALTAVDLGAGRTAVALSGGAYYTCALLDNGTVKCWGENPNGELGQGDVSSRGDGPGEMGDSLPAISLGAGRTATAVEAGNNQACAILDDGSVKCWGRNVEGQLGLADTLNRGDGAGEMGDNLPAVMLQGIPLALTVTKAGSGAGTVTSGLPGIACGAACAHDFNPGTAVTLTASPSAGSFFAGWTGGVCSGIGTCVVAMNAVKAVTANFSLPRRLAVGGSHACAMLGNNTVKCWGRGVEGELGNGDAAPRGDASGEMGDNLAVISLGTGRTAKALASGSNFSCAILDNDTLKCWGQNTKGQLGLGDTFNRGDALGEMGDVLFPVSLGTGRTAAVVDGGAEHACALLDNAAVKCWGDNTYGELGLGNTLHRGDSPGEMGDLLPAVSLGAGRTATAIAVGATHSCALLDDATVKCWGDNASGALGQGDNLNRGDGAGEMGDSLPAVNLGTGRTATAVGAGDSFTCALLDDGSVKCWGKNTDGRLGLGDTAHRGDGPGEMGDALPAVSLGAGRTATGIAVGGAHACALLDDRTTKCWGHNTEGELGLGDAASRGDGPGEMGDALPAISLGAGREAAALSTENESTCALLDDLSLKCWGNNSQGQLGLADASHRGDGAGEMGDNLPAVMLTGLPFVLTVVKAGAGAWAWSVDSSPPGISCGASCQHDFNPNAVVTLTASPIGGYVFAGWSGAGCSGTGACVVAMSAARSVTATFSGAILPSCAVEMRVKQDGTQDHLTIQAAVDSLAKNLAGDACVVVRDTETYAEQVTVQGFTNNGYQVWVVADPSFVSSAPVVSPPANSTAAFHVLNASVTLGGFSVLGTDAMPYGVLASSAYVTISSVNVDSAGKIASAGIALSSWSALSYSSVTVQSVPGVWLTTGAIRTTVSYSTAAAGAGSYGLYLTNASSNTFTEVLASAAGGAGGAYLSGSRFNSVSQSTFTAGAGGTALMLDAGSSTNTFQRSYFFNPVDKGVGIISGSDYNTVTLSTISAMNDALTIAASSGNAISKSSIESLWVHAVYLLFNAKSNSFSQSTFTTQGPTCALFLGNGSSNTFTQSYFDAPNGWGASLWAGSDWNTISQSTLTSNSSLAPGLQIELSAYNTVSQSVIRGSTSTAVVGSTGTVIRGSVLTAADPAGRGLWVSRGSVGLSMTSNTVIPGALGAGIELDPGNTGAITLTSTTFLGGAYGLVIGDQGASVAVASMTFRGMSANATGVRWLGGSPVSIFSFVNLDDANLLVNADGSSLGAGSRITMCKTTGVRAGAAFENDPGGFIDWGLSCTSLPPGCGTGVNVRKDGNADFTTIQAAVNSLSRNLLAPTCVVVRDTNTYSEQVTVQGFTNNDYTLSVMKDPSFISSSPVVSPPAASTAAFHVLNTSVTIRGFLSAIGFRIPFGIKVSSTDVTIAGVTVEGGNNVYTAGILLSSWTTVDRSSVVVQNVTGMWLTGLGGAVVDSTSSVSGAAQTALLVDGSSGTVRGSRFMAPNGWAGYVRSNGNSVSGSTFSANAALYPTVLIMNASGNTISGSSITNTGGAGGSADALYLFNAHGNVIASSTLSARGFGTILELVNSSHNVVSGSYLSYTHSGDPPCATAAILDGTGNLVDRSTVTSNSSSCQGMTITGSSATLQDSLVNKPVTITAGWSLVLRSTVTSTVVGGSSVAFEGSFVDGTLQFGSDYASVTRSTVAANSAGPALQILGSSSAVTGSVVRNRGAGDAIDLVNGHHGLVETSTAAGNSGFGVYLLNSADNTIRDSHIQGGTGLRMSGATRASVLRSRLVATALAGNGIYHTSGPDALVSSCVVNGGGGGHALYFQGESNSTVRLSSVTVLGGWRGVTVDPLNGGPVSNFGVAASSIAIIGPMAVNSIGINLGAGTVVSTFAYVVFEDANLNPNVEGIVLGAGSRVTVCGASGARAGPGFESDPGDRVEWQASCWVPAVFPNPAGCLNQFNVRRDGSTEYTGIQLAVNALPSSLSGDQCVVVRDTETYAEQVTVQGFANNGFRVRVFSDPSFVSSAPVVSPPAASTAAFVVANDSVTLGGFSVLGTNDMPYGVFGSSALLTVSSVNVDSGGRIKVAGMFLSSWTVLSASSVTAQSSHGLLLTGKGSLVANSTFSSQGAASSGVLLDGASTSTLRGIVASGGDGEGLFLRGGGWNTIQDALATSQRFKPGMSLASSPGNSVVSGVFQSVQSTAAALVSSHFTGITGSVMTAAAPGASAFWSSSSSNNVVSGAAITNSAGHAVLIQGGAANRLDSSQVTSLGAGFAGLWVLASSSLTVTGTTAQGSTGALVQSSTGTVIELSVLSANQVSGHGLRASGGLVNLTLSTSVFTGGAQGYGVWLDSGSAGLLHMASGTVRGSSWGLALGSQTAALAIADVTFSDLPAGATAMVLFGGVVVTTFSGINFGDDGLGTNVNGKGLASGSRVTMRSAAGLRTGQPFEVDPGGRVDWPEIPVIIYGPWPLVVDKTGPGVIQSIPAGIRCGEVCGAFFPQDTLVVLTSQRPATVKFGGWGGDCQGTGGCFLVMRDSMTVTATFTQPKDAVSSYPNPFGHDGTRFAYQLVQAADVEIRVFTMSGRQIAVITDRGKAAGFNETAWNGRDSEGREVARGLYQYRFKAVAGSSEWVRNGTMAKIE